MLLVNITQFSVMEPMTGFEPATPSLPWRCSTTELHRLLHLCNRAEDETRTRDPQLGRLMLYQLSYFRIFTHLSSGGDRIRTYSVETPDLQSGPALQLRRTP